MTLGASYACFFLVSLCLNLFFEVSLDIRCPTSVLEHKEHKDKDPDADMVNIEKFSGTKGSFKKLTKKWKLNRQGNAKWLQATESPVKTNFSKVQQRIILLTEVQQNNQKKSRRMQGAKQESQEETEGKHMTGKQTQKQLKTQRGKNTDFNTLGR